MLLLYNQMEKYDESCFFTSKQKASANSNGESILILIHANISSMKGSCGSIYNLPNR